jgi:glycosyltransferase involved in cell wall biosynthesis
MEALTLKTKSLPTPILLFTESLKPGGTEKEVLLVCMHLNREKFAPLVVSLNGRGEVADQLRALPVPVVDLGFKSYKNIISPIKTIVKVVKLIQQHRIKILHAYSFGPTILGAIAALFTRTRLISSQRNIHLWNDSKYRRAYQIALLNADRILSNSETGRDVVLQNLDEFENKVQVIYNLVEEPRVEKVIRVDLRRQLGLAERDIVIGMVANLRPLKNPGLFVDTAINICKKSKRVVFIHLGGGSEVPALQQKVKIAGLSDRIRFLGAISPANPYYESMDIFVLTSNSEGCPMAVLEAMSHGLPVVATRISGVREVVRHGVNGLLVPPDNRAAFSRALRRLIANPVTRRQMGKNSRRIFHEQFETSKVVPKLEQVYEQLL